MFVGGQMPFVLWTLHHADGIGCVSRELVEKCRTLCGREDIRFMPNAVELDVFRPQPKDLDLQRALSLEGEIVLGFVGELRFKKGTQFILDALREVRQRHPARLLLVGGMRSEDRSFLRRYLREFPDLRPAVHAVEYVQDRKELAKYYSLMDVVLSPSLWDGMPNSVLEAMACGRLVVASNVGGIRDAITHGETGFLVDVHELHRLGEGCIELIEAGEAARQEIGLRARRYVEEHHRPEQEVARILDIYNFLAPRSPS
jgi:glycosyltransferase involved in cell wall biosynthesis